MKQCLSIERGVKSDLPAAAYGIAGGGLSCDRIEPIHKKILLSRGEIDDHAAA